MRGYKEKGATTTPFDMVVMNDLNRFHLVRDVIERVPELARIGAHANQKRRALLIDHKHRTNTYGDDIDRVWNWKWPY